MKMPELVDMSLSRQLVTVVQLAEKNLVIILCFYIKGVHHLSLFLQCNIIFSSFYMSIFYNLAFYVFYIYNEKLIYSRTREIIGITIHKAGNETSFTFINIVIYKIKMQYMCVNNEM